MKNTKKAPCKNTCNNKTEETFKLDVTWGWQVDAIFYSLAANFLLGTATLITLFLRK